MDFKILPYRLVIDDILTYFSLNYFNSELTDFKKFLDDPFYDLKKYWGYFKNDKLRKPFFIFHCVYIVYHPLWIKKGWIHYMEYVSSCFSPETWKKTGLKNVKNIIISQQYPIGTIKRIWGTNLEIEYLTIKGSENRGFKSITEERLSLHNLKGLDIFDTKSFPDLLCSNLKKLELAFFEFLTTDKLPVFRSLEIIIIRQVDGFDWEFFSRPEAKNLRTIHIDSTDVNNPKIWTSMPYLKMLTIHYIKFNIQRLFRLQKFENLIELFYVCGTSNKSLNPLKFSNCEKLEILMLRNIFMNTSSDPTVFHNLYKIKLSDMDDFSLDFFSSNEFPNLSVLKLTYIKFMETGVSQEWNEFPKMRSLKIENCRNFTEKFLMKQTFKHITKLYILRNMSCWIPFSFWKKFSFPKLESYGFDFSQIDYPIF